MKKTLLFFSLLIISINSISASFYARRLDNYESWSNAEILKCDTKVELYGILYETTVNLKVKLGQSYQWGANQYYCQNPYAGRYEFIWTFSLPQNSFIKGLSVFNNKTNEFVSARIIDLSSGEIAYNPNSNESTNTLLRQYMRRDYNGDYSLNYELKISPVNWDESAEFILSIVSPVEQTYNKRVLDIFTNQFYTGSGTYCYTNQPAKFYVLDYNNPNAQPYHFEGNPFNWTKVNNFWYTNTTFNNFYISKLSLPPESDNGKFLRTYSLAGNNFYQLSTLPHININLRPSRKIIVAFDLIQDYFGSYSRENFFTMLKDALMISTTEKDSIVFVTSDFDVKWLNQNFQQRSENLIDTYLNTIKGIKPRLNLLPYMLKDIVKYLNEKDVDAEVWLVSDDYQTGVRAETVMELLDHTYFKANKKLVYNIIDVSSTWYSYYIQNKYYRGNEYLYENLSRLSGSNFAKMYDKYYMYYIDDALDCWAPKVSTVEIDPIPNNGFTYSRVNLSNRNNFHIGARYFQIGMFEGDLPINVNYFGNYLKNPYFNSIDLPEDYTEVPESMTLNTALYWFGNYIMKDLFLQPQSYSTIKYIEELSVQNRLLTPYSAFVIPGPTGYSGYVRIYEDEITNIEEINQSEDEEVIPTELAISSYPNPFNPSTNIIMSIPANLANQEKQFDIYNILGEKVKSFDMTQYNNLSEIHINWSGMNDYGNAVASGMYIAVFKVGNIIKSLKLLLVR